MILALCRLSRITHLRGKGYDEQVREYVAAVARFLGDRSRALVVFLNVGGQARVVTFDTSSGCGKIQILNIEL